MNLRQTPFPGIMLAADSPRAAESFVVVGTLAAVLLTCGVLRRASAVLLWYLLASFVQRNTLIADPSTPFTGWLLLATTLVPAGEPLTATNWSRLPRPGWQFPQSIYVAIWIVLGASYSVSGLIKLGTAEWTDGRALGMFLSNTLHRHGVIWSTLSGLPPMMLAVGTWGGLAAELLAGPLAISRWTRPLAWVGLVAMHLIILSTMRTTMLSLGALLPLAFAFDVRWLRVLASQRHDTAPAAKHAARSQRHARRKPSRQRRAS
jgi:tryptophan-rich sensory protein